jgi:hypothetical protein
LRPGLQDDVPKQLWQHVVAQSEVVSAKSFAGATSTLKTSSATPSVEQNHEVNDSSLCIQHLHPFK